MRVIGFTFSMVFLFAPFFLFAQVSSVTVSGRVLEKANKNGLAYVNVVLKNEKDSSFATATVTNEEGRFALTGVKPGNYYLEVTIIGFMAHRQALYVGSLTAFLDLAHIELGESSTTLNEVLVSGKQDEVGAKMDKKTFNIQDNISQSGGSVLQAMQNLPGVSVQEGKVLLRGNDRVAVLIDGKQTALTGFGNQTSLDNIPASAIEKIEIINNPSAKYDANGNAGIINIIYKKNTDEGFNGKVGMASGLGALWVKKENLPNIRPQYQGTPKLNPSLSLNYRKKKVNAFFQGDYLYTPTLNKNEFVNRVYDDGSIINQQTKRNRNTTVATAKGGMDWSINSKNSFTLSGLFSSEKILDHGDEPFFNKDYTERFRLWQFLEDELKTTVTASAIYQHKFKQPGHLLNIALNYTYHRENEKYFFDNILPTFAGKDAFKLISDEHVGDLNVDYVKPLKYGRFEGGLKLRPRVIPTNMLFIPGINSPLDTNAGGKATYRETIPALYGNYVFENKKYEAEVGLRLEYVRLQYEVDPRHNTYKSNGYNYAQPFPNMRFAYKINDHNKLSVFYNRRVDRPNEVDIRVFPKYDDAEIIKVGNPALKPQFTNSFELGYKTTWRKGYFYSALYHRIANGTITRISSIVPGKTLIYAIFQNVNKSFNTGVEMVWSQSLSKKVAFNLNFNVYRNQIDAFSISNLYPSPHISTSPTQKLVSGNVKLNTLIHLPKGLDAQFTAIYLAPDLIPQGKIYARFSLDVGLKKAVNKGKAEWFINATDLLNTMVIKKYIQGDGFHYTSADYYETQVIRVGYNRKF
jgi:outer membrane receptor protein involved in Fe transport